MVCPIIDLQSASHLDALIHRADGMYRSRSVSVPKDRTGSSYLSQFSLLTLSTLSLAPTAAGVEQLEAFKTRENILPGLLRGSKVRGH